jgi:hypothetical protein
MVLTQSPFIAFTAAHCLSITITLSHLLIKTAFSV